MNATGLLFEIEDVVRTRPVRPAPTPTVTASASASASEDDLTTLAGVALWGPLLDRLNVVAEADRRGLREIGPTGYSGGECYRALTEILLVGGDFLSDRSLIAWRHGGACGHSKTWVRTLTCAFDSRRGRRWDGLGGHAVVCDLRLDPAGAGAGDLSDP